MKKNKILSLVFICTFFTVFSDSAFGQRKTITSNEFYAANQAAAKKQSEVSRRVETTEETFSEGNLSKTIYTVTETLLPDRTRSYVKETAGGEIKESETITIGYFQYTRENGGAWTKKDLRQQGSGSGYGVGAAAVDCRQYTVEPTFLNGRAAQLFEELSINKGQNGLEYEERKVWISDEGLTLKIGRVKGLLSPRTENSRTATLIEYDPNIKIEAPIN